MTLSRQISQQYSEICLLAVANDIDSRPVLLKNKEKGVLFLSKLSWILRGVAIVFILAAIACQVVTRHQTPTTNESEPKMIPQVPATVAMADGTEIDDHDKKFSDAAAQTKSLSPRELLFQEWSQSPERLAKMCYEELSSLPGSRIQKDIRLACNQVRLLDVDCFSTNGSPIYHFDRIGSANDGKKILAIATIHGDEGPSGSVARAWMSRLQKLDPRNTWRVIPVANPDGLKLKTRTNANGVDLNRNFPTSDWSDLALIQWQEKQNGRPRRYPGPGPASEIETQCLVQHIQQFKPDFIISVHTPLGVLDFDGPPVQGKPQFQPLPWISLGHFPGSLGRYMWKENDVPVLTIELKGSSGIQKLVEFDRLQDISGTVAIQSDRYLEKKRQRKKEDEDQEISRLEPHNSDT